MARNCANILLLLLTIIYTPYLLALPQDTTASSANTDIVPNNAPEVESSILEKYLIPVIMGLLVTVIGYLIKKYFDYRAENSDLKAEKQIYQSTFKNEVDEKLSNLQQQIKYYEFCTRREKLYRELDLPFMHWQGVENCVIFKEKEKRQLTAIKEFDNPEYKKWLAAKDFLLLAIYKEVVVENHSKALELINHIYTLQSNPTEIQASANLQKARILMEHEENNIPEILDLLEKAKKLNPHNISCLYYYAKVNNDIREYKVAASILEELREIKQAEFFPVNISLTLADVYTSLKKYDNALELVESYLIFHPYHVKSIKSKASIYFHNKKITNEAIERFREQIMSINTGDDPELHYAVALLEYRLQKYDEAEKRLDRIIVKRHRFVDYRILLANIYFDRENEEKLLDTLRKIVNIDSDKISKRKIKNVIEKIEKHGLLEAKKKLRFNIGI
ncbi:hypothetical protein GF337_03610 [candidate division KSB1 bacterium]|nr:hypothetical protein [candidate division KSB1 bacterium]